MDLRDVLAAVESEAKTLVVRAPTDDMVADVREYFSSQNVDVEYGELTTGHPHVAVTADGEDLVTVDARAVERFVTGTEPRELGEDPLYQPLLEHLDRTTFTSYDRAQMLRASREVEDRAWRGRTGQLHAGFQRLSNVASQRRAYELLTETDLDVHLYGEDDATIDLDATVHASDDPDITSTWFVVYDGGRDDDQKSALLAEERAPGEFYGFWTYDETIVDDLLSVLADYRARCTSA